MSSLTIMLLVPLGLGVIVYVLVYVLASSEAISESIWLVESGFVTDDVQFLDNVILSYSWLLVLFVLFDVELVLILGTMYLSTAVPFTTFIVLVMSASVILEWSLHAMTW